MLADDDPVPQPPPAQQPVGTQPLETTTALRPLHLVKQNGCPETKDDCGWCREDAIGFLTCRVPRSNLSSRSRSSSNHSSNHSSRSSQSRAGIILRRRRLRDKRAATLQPRTQGTTTLRSAARCDPPSMLAVGCRLITVRRKF